jgi:hypothetical protein
MYAMRLPIDLLEFLFAAHNRPAISAEIHRVSQVFEGIPIQPEQRPSKKNRPMCFVHGTAAAKWKSPKIDLTQGLRNLDFGQGFYLFPDTPSGRRMAAFRAKQKAKFDGGEACIIRFRKNADWDQLNMVGLDEGDFAEQYGDKHEK